MDYDCVVFATKQSFQAFHLICISPFAKKRILCEVRCCCARFQYSPYSILFSVIELL